MAQLTLVFSPSELAANELKINLAPGIFGRNKSMPLLLKTADNARPGLWQNEFRIANTPAVPRGPGDFLAKSPLASTCRAAMQNIGKCGLNMIR